MDREHFNTVSHRIAATPSRRATFGALLGAALAGTLRTTAAKKKRRKKCNPACSECPCPGGRLRLPNETCAAVCDSEDDCPAICTCGGVSSVEGNRHCAPVLEDCPDVPQSCEDTAQCPLGQFCVNLNICGKRCVPVCG